MNDKECFALRKGRCTVLNVKKCRDLSCSFFKTELQYKGDRQKSLKRLGSLDTVTIKHISETYYGGNMGVNK